MRKIVNLILTLLLVFGVIFTSPFSVSAASTDTQDGLEVTITTDKLEYIADEDIQVWVNVKNNNSYTVEDVSIETFLPEGLVMKSGKISVTDIDIEAGKSYTAYVVVQLDEELRDNDEINPPPTGDNSNIVFVIVMIVASAIGIFITFKFKKTRQVMSIFLCLVIVFSMIPMSVFAMDTVAVTNDENTITVDKNIIVDGEAYTIKVNVEYIGNVYVLQPVIELQSNSCLTYDDSSSKYILSETMDTLSGTMSNYEKIKSSYFELVYNEIDVSTYSFEPKDKWSVQNFGLLPGENILKFYMTDVNEDVWEQSIIVFCNHENNISSIIEDNTSDKDDDNLPDYIEELFGTDPNNKDTDGDGVSDDVEGNIIGCDARKFDSDDDGISDGDEDADEDGLSNLEEIQANTNPCNYDTDNDSLNDYEEIHIYGTSPVKKDTDGDGLDDDWEIKNEKDPLVAEETVSVSDSMTSGDSIAEITLDLPSELAQSFVIGVSEEEILSTNIPGQLSTPVSLTIEGELPDSGAVLRFSVSEDYPTEETEDFIPMVYYYDPSTQMLEEVPTTYNNHIAEAHLEHFSTYILLNKKDFDAIWEDEIRPPVDSGNETTRQNLDMLLLIDCSGSMGPQGANNDPQNIRLDVSKKLVEKLGENDKAAVASFGEVTTLLSGFNSDKSVLYSAIELVGNTDVETNINDALNNGFSIFDNSSRNDSIKYMILLTDGSSTDYVYGYEEAAKQRNIVIYTVGLGKNVDDELLKEIANSTGGKYYHATKAEDLYEIYDAIEEETVDYVTDSNNDGISDYYTRLIAEGKLHNSVGKNYFSRAITREIYEQYPNCIDVSELIYQAIQANDDFDDDGLKNGEELIITQNGDKVYVKMISDPVCQNSDGDIFTKDGLDKILGGNPLKYEIKETDLTWLTNDEVYLAALSAERFVDSAWYRLQLGLGNYIFGGEYDWSYAAQKQLLECIEVYAENLTESYEAIYLSETYLEITDNLIDEMSDKLSLYGNIVEPVEEAHVIREIIGYMIELTEARNELDKMDLSNMDLIVAKCGEMSGIYSKIDSGTDKLKNITNFTEYTSLTKISLKVPTWVNKISGEISEIGNGLEKISAIINTVDSIGSTISGYGKIRAVSQTYSTVYNVLCELRDNSKIKFVSIAASTLIKSIESQYIQMVNEINLVLSDYVYSWDEIGIDLILSECGPIGWAIGLGRGLGNLITGVSDTCKQHIYMITAGEAGTASAKLLDASIIEKGRHYCQVSDSTLEYMLLCGTLRIVGENEMIKAGDEQSWLFKLINKQDDVEEYCLERMKLVESILLDYGLIIIEETKNGRKF